MRILSWAAIGGRYSVLSSRLDVTQEVVALAHAEEFSHPFVVRSCGRRANLAGAPRPRMHWLSLEGPRTNLHGPTPDQRIPGLGPRRIPRNQSLGVTASQQIAYLPNCHTAYRPWSGAAP